MSFLVPSEMTESLTRDLIKVLKDADQPVPEEVRTLKSFAEERKRSQRMNKRYQNSDRITRYNRDSRSSSGGYGSRSGFNREFIQNERYSYQQQKNRGIFHDED